MTSDAGWDSHTGRPAGPDTAGGDRYGLWLRSGSGQAARGHGLELPHARGPGAAGGARVDAPERARDRSQPPRPARLGVPEPRVRSRAGLGIVVCCEQSTVAQRVRGLRLGADDWVGKPCHPEEVIARVEAVVRRRKRAAAPSESPSIVAGELEVRPDQFQAYVGGHNLELTRREFELLHLLAEAPGHVLQRGEVDQRGWAY